MIEKPRRLIGYARVSTTDQNPDMQISALRKYGVPEALIFVDTASGGTAIKRPNFIRALKYAKRKDTEFVVWKLDRLGRTLVGILDTLKLFEENSVRFKSLTEDFDTSTPMGKAMVHLLAVFAQLERDMIQERTLEGIRRKRERGEVHGRPIVMTPERDAEAKRLLAEGMTGPEVLERMRKLPGPKISRSAFYKWHRLNHATYRKAVRERDDDTIY